MLQMRKECKEQYDQSNMLRHWRYPKLLERVAWLHQKPSGLDNSNSYQQS